MPLKYWFFLFLLALGGVISDYFTTIVGLGMGFSESNPHYHPFLALLVYWLLIAVLNFTLPKKRPWSLSAIGPALISYLGAVNNTLLIMGFL